MKRKLLIAVSLTSLVLGSAVMTSCGERVYYERPGYPTNYGTGVLDSEGFPIFGYISNRPVYAFNTVGQPVYNKSSIRQNYFVPSWEPKMEYDKKKYYYPKGVNRMDRIPHSEHNWRIPQFDADKPSVIYPTKPNPYRDPQRWNSKYASHR